MDTDLFSGDIYRDETAMEARVVTFAVRTYGDQVSHELLERWAREAVVKVWGEGPNVTKFVPMLALRQVREHVEAHTAKHAAAHRSSTKPEQRTLEARVPQSLLDQHARYGSKATKSAAPATPHSLIRDATQPQHQRGHERTG